MNDSLYHSGSTEILNEEVYPGDSIAFQDRTLGQVTGRVKKFFTRVSQHENCMPLESVMITDSINWCELPATGDTPISSVNPYQSILV